MRYRSRDGFPGQSNRRKTMSDDELKNSTALTPIGDGFDGYSDDGAGSDNSQQQQQGIIRGMHVTFGATAEYERRDGETIGSDVKLIVTGIVRAVLKWPPGKNERPETTVIPPGAPFPDIEAMNNDVPQDQWRQGPAGPQGPYQAQRAITMIEPISMDEFTFTTSTIGGTIACTDLVHKVNVMRRYRGPVSPIITLGDAPMRTRYGERRRPSFHIVDWIRMGGDEPQQAALPAPSPAGSGSNAARVIEAKPEPAKEAAEPAKKPKRSKSGSFKRAEPLSTKEELNDEIPW
jgi:hypothetical protein